MTVVNKNSELAKNTAIIAVGKISTQFLSFLLLPLYTYVLSPESYGFVDLAVLYVGLLAPTITVQMEMAVFRFLIDERAEGSQKSRSATISSACFVFICGIIIGGALLFLISLIFHIRHGLIIALLFVSLALIGLTLQITRGLGSNKHYSIASIIVGISGVTLNLVFLLILKFDAAGILLASMIANLVGVIYLMVVMEIYKYIRFSSISKTTIKALLRYSWPLVPNHISLWGVNGIGRTIVSVVMGVAAVGIYAVASKLALAYTQIYSIFAMSWTESAAMHIKTKDDFFSQVTDNTVRLFGSMALLIIATLSIFFPLLVGSEFNSARNLIPILIAGSFFGSIVTHYGAIYLAVKRTGEVAKVTIQALVISSILTGATISFIGLYAPAIAFIVTYLYIAIRRHFDVQKYVDIRYRTQTFLALFGLAIPTIGSYYIDHLGLSVIALFVTVCGVILLNRALAQKVLTMIASKFRTRKKKEETIVKKD